MNETEQSGSIQPTASATRVPRWTIPVVVMIALLLIVLAAVWLIARRNGGEKEVEPVVEVEVAAPARVDMHEYVEAGGTLSALPGREASFSAATAGKVTRVLVQVGQHVLAGQTLAELDRSVLAAQVRQAQAALLQARATSVEARTVSGTPSQTIAADQIKQAEGALATAHANETLAQSNLERQRRLFERGIAPRKDVDDAETQARVSAAAVKQAESGLAAARVNAAKGIGEARTQSSVAAGGVEAAQAALDVARAELSRAAIRSPINGTVTKRAINDGEAVDPATPAFEVIDSSSLDLVANLPAGYLSRVKTGNQASVHMEPAPEKEFTGGVVQVAPAVDSQTNTVAVRVRLANPDGELKAGVFANARISVEVHQDALAVPQTALVVEGDDSFVFVSHGDKVEKRKVTVGIRDQQQVEIAEGLKQDEKVVTEGAYGLGDGTRIKIVQSESPDKSAPGKY
jgi:HlyD family secretion protein